RGGHGAASGTGAVAATVTIVACLSELAAAMPEVEWFIHVDAGLLLIGDAWAHVASRGVALDADVCADVTTDDRIDAAGHMVIACAAFSAATCRELGALLRSWDVLEPALDG